MSPSQSFIADENAPWCHQYPLARLAGAQPSVGLQKHKTRTRKLRLETLRKIKMMHSVDLLEEALDLARSSGFEVRQWLGESSGGACRIGSRWVVFVNASLTAEEQLTGVIVALRRTGQLFDTATCSPKLQRLLSTVSQPSRPLQSPA